MAFFKTSITQSLAWLAPLAALAAFFSAHGGAAQAQQFCGGELLLDQPPPNPNSTCGFSDVYFPSSLSDNMVLPAPRSISELVVWGSYPAGTPLLTDVFTVVFRSDDGGLPGTTRFIDATVAVARALSGGVVSGHTEFRYILTLTAPVFLPAGTYWVEIFNDSSTAGKPRVESWCWSFGTPDANKGITGFAFAGQPLAATWSTSPLSEAHELSVQICGESPVPVIPTLSGRGLAAMVSLLAVAAIGLILTRSM